MSARAMVQAAILARLQATPDLAGTPLFDAPPVRAARPYGVIDEPVLSDWSTATWRGLEGRIAVSLYDGGERPVRLRALMAAVDEALPALAGDIGAGWRIANLIFVRSRLVRAAPDGWRTTSEFAVRLYRLES